MSNNIEVQFVKNLTLITGGARSGKSSFAESLAARSDGPVYYIATMEEMQSDPETLDRIKRHRERRPAHWITVEAINQAEEAILDLNSQAGVCIFDCLSLYVSNILLDCHASQAEPQACEERVFEAAQDLLDAMRSKPDTRFFVVTNEVGWGVVPENGLARMYRDLLGWTNQMFARAACEVWLSCVGIQIRLKP